MRILVALIVGIIIGYVAFAPGMASVRQDGWAKINELTGAGPTSSPAER